MTIGENIKTYRQKRQYTQQQLADLLYVTPQAVSQWERGVTVPDAEKLTEIAQILHTTVNALTNEQSGAQMDWIPMDSYFSAEHMYSRLTSYVQVENLRQTFFALRFMREKHAGQFRKTTILSGAKVPYITHPLLMACHAHSLGMREDGILAACLLHDVCEDCGVTPEELPVSETVQKTVQLLSFQTNPGESKQEAKERYYREIAADRIATIVKVLDRCNNISTMANAFSEEKLIAYIDETETYVLPLLEHAKNTIPEYSDAIFLIKYHMRSVLETLKCMILRLG